MQPYLGCSDLYHSSPYPAGNLSPVGNEDLVKSLRGTKKKGSVQSIIDTYTRVTQMCSSRNSGAFKQLTIDHTDVKFVGDNSLLHLSDTLLSM